MTSTQIAYWNLQEQKRANLAREEETNRSNVANEVERARANRVAEAHNVSVLQETNRANLAKEGETNRSNLAREEETNRTNLINEAINNMRVRGDIEIRRRQLDHQRNVDAWDIELAKKEHERKVKADRRSYELGYNQWQTDAMYKESAAGLNNAKTFNEGLNSIRTITKGLLPLFPHAG